MTFYSNTPSVFDRLSAAETESSSRKRTTLSEIIGKTTTSLQSGSTYGHDASQYSSRASSLTPRSRSTASSSLFNRLANTETYATASMKGKIPSPPPDRQHQRNGIQTQRSSNEFWHRLAYTETFSTAQLKGKNSQEPKSSDSKNKTSDSFFHRMAYSETYSTASKKGLVDTSPPKNTPQKVTNSDFFERMSKTDTYATASMKAVYEYGKSPETPGRKTYASPDIFERLASAHTKASSLKKSSSWKKREEFMSRIRPRATRNAGVFKRLYSDRSHTPDQSVRSSASLMSSRSVRSEKSIKSFRSNIAEYSRPTTPSFVSRLSKSKPKPAPTPQKSPSPTKQPFTKSLSSRSHRSKSSSSSAPTRITASERLRQQSVKERQLSRKANTSPSRNSLVTSTTSSISSFTSSKKDTTSISSRSSRPKPKPKPKPKPAPRPVLQFDSDDDFSFGDSEEEEDFDFGVKSKEEKEQTPAPQDDLSKNSNSRQLNIEKKNIGTNNVIEDDEIEVVLNKEQFNETNEGLEEALSVDTASIDDILGGNTEEAEESENEASFSIEKESRDFEDEPEPIEEGLKSLDSPSQEEQDTENMNNDQLDDIMNGHTETNGNHVNGTSNVDSNTGDEELDEFLDKSEHNEKTDVILNKSSEIDELDDIFAESKETEEEDNIAHEQKDNEEADDIFGETTIDHQKDESRKESREVPNNLIDDDDDDISMGDESFEDEISHKVADIQLEPKDMPEEEEDMLPENSMPEEEDMSQEERGVPEEEDVMSEQVKMPEEEDVMSQEEDMPQVEKNIPQEKIELEPQAEEKMTDQDDPIEEPQYDQPDQEEPQEDVQEEEDVSSQSEEEDAISQSEEEKIISRSGVSPEEEDEDNLSQELSQDEDEPQEELNEANQSMDSDTLNGETDKGNALNSLDFILDASSTIVEEPEMEEGQYDEESEIVEEDDDSMFDSDSEYESEYEDDSEYESEVEGEAEQDDALPPLKYKLLISDKYHPEYGLEELYPDDLFLVDSLVAFEEGAITNQELAVLIIESLFERDFEDGEHWEIDDGTARDLEDDEGGGGELKGCAFVVKRQARLDWNDLYSVAAAKGTIIISAEKDEIKVENYSYFVAG